MAAAKRQHNHDEIVVNIHPHSCEPNALTVPAGRASFRIVNRSERAVEWEILDGVLVVEERENIAPGLSRDQRQPATGRLCDHLRLAQQPARHLARHTDSRFRCRRQSQAVDGGFRRAAVGISRVSGRSGQRVDQSGDGAESGDRQWRCGAGASVVPAGAYRLSASGAGGAAPAELDNQINARADYFEKREQDPAFVGFHRLEYALFEQRKLDDVAPIAQRLLADVTVLKQQLLAQSPPEQLVGIVVRNLNSLADVRAGSGEEERYSRSDLNGFAANAQTARKVVDLLRPMLSKSAADVLANVDRAMSDFDYQLNAFKSADGYVSYDAVTAAQRQQIAAKAKALAAAMDGIDPALGLSGL